MLALLLGCPVEIDTGKAAGCDDPAYAFVDEDGDGQGDLSTGVLACAGESDGVALAGDCDDADPAVFLGADERCNEADDDCDGEVDEDAVDAGTWYTDADGDGHGAGEAIVACVQPDGAVASSDDGDDADASTYPGAAERCDGVDNDGDGEVDEPGAEGEVEFFLDDDGDGRGDAAVSVTACDPPVGHVDNDDDCDDANPLVFAGAEEGDCTDPVDYNCDGSVGYADADLDGVAACEDCDDANAEAVPGGLETCDGVDQDCDGEVDEDANDAVTWYADGDGDGHGGSLTVESCEAPTGFVGGGDDCDDSLPGVSPSGIETCDGVDQDCDGSVDDDATDAATWHADGDGDGHGSAVSSTPACEAPAGHLADDSDCDDADPWAYPGAAETCDGLDDDCDGVADEEPVSGGDPWYADADGDGHGDPASMVSACAAPADHVADATDCDDGNAAVYPGASESCDGADEDCDGAIDEGTPSGALDWFLDYDGDGFGAGSPVAACAVPPGHVADSTDCNDTDPAAYPGATEWCNGRQDDCDGTWTSDAGLVSFQDADGSWTDWTSTFAAGTSGAPVAVNVTESGGLNVCAGTWYVQLSVASALSVDIVGPDGAEETILDAGGSGRPLYTGNYGTFLVRGLTLQNGSGTYGGGAYFDYFSTIQVDECIVQENLADYGGGIGGYFLHSSVSIRNTIIRDNVASQYGGGLDFGSYGGGHSALTLIDSEIDSNQADYGGGAYIVYGTHTAELRGLDVHDNAATTYGGGLSIIETTTTITASSIHDNLAGAGAGLRLANWADVTLDGTLVYENVATGGGGGIYTHARWEDLSNDLWLVDSAVYDNSAGTWGGGVQLNWTDAWCLGDTTGSYGVYGNTAVSGGSDVYAYANNTYGDNTVTAVGCDLGDPRDGTDGELYLEGVGTYTYGLDADFDCDASACR